MANRLNELISTSIKYIESAEGTGALRYAPASPIVFIYLDRHSLCYREDLCKKMNECWGHRTESFMHILLSDGVLYEEDENGEWMTETDQYEITEKVLDIEDIQFNSSGEVKLFFILNTATVNSLEHFKELFGTVSRFSDIEAVEFLTNFVMIEALAIKPSDVERRQAIRRFLCTPEAQEAYNAVFLLSNQLPKGVLRKEKEAHNYELLGNIAVIINNDDEGKTNRRNLLYNLAGRNAAITGSLLKYQKPVRAITVKSYLKLLEIITEELMVIDSHYRIPEMELKQALELTPSSGFDFLLKKLNGFFEETLPKQEELRCLPNINPDVISIRPAKQGDILNRNSVFAYLDSMTLNAWTPFYEMNFRSAVEKYVNDEFKESIRQKIVQLLTDRFSYAQLTMLMESGAEELVESGFPKALSTKPLEDYGRLYGFIRNVVREDIYAELKDVFLDTIRRIDHEAEEYYRALNQIKVGLTNMAQDNSENADLGSIDSFYGSIVRNYLMKTEVNQKVRSTFKRVYSDENTVLVLLEELYKNMIEACPEYKLNFESELGKRITAGHTGAHAIIAQILNANDDDIISLKSPVKPALIHGYYLARKEADYMQLVQRGQDSIVDTNSASSAEHVRLYGCMDENLFIE